MASRFLGLVDFPAPTIEDNKPDEGPSNLFLRNTSAGAVAAQAFASTAGTFKSSFIASDVNSDNLLDSVNLSTVAASSNSFASSDMPKSVSIASESRSSVRGPFFVAETSDDRSLDSGSAVSGHTHAAAAAAAAAASASAAGGAGGAASVTIYNYMPPSDDAVAKAQWRQPPVTSSPPPARADPKPKTKTTVDHSEKLQRKANQTAIQISQAAIRMSKIYQQLATNDDTRAPLPKMQKQRAQAEAKRQESEIPEEEKDAEIVNSLADVIGMNLNEDIDKEPQVQGLQGEGPQAQDPQVSPEVGDKQQKAARKGTAKSSKKRCQPKRKAQQAADKKDSMVRLAEAGASVPEEKQPDTGVPDKEAVELIAAEVEEPQQVVGSIASEKQIEAATALADVESASEPNAESDVEPACAEAAVEGPRSAVEGAEAAVEAIVKDAQEPGDAETAMEARDQQEAGDADSGEAMRSDHEAEGNAKRAARRPPGSVGTFAGRRPPKDPKKLEVFLGMKRIYQESMQQKGSKKAKTASEGQLTYWNFMQGEMARLAAAGVAGGDRMRQAAVAWRAMQSGSDNDVADAESDGARLADSEAAAKGPRSAVQDKDTVKAVKVEATDASA